MVARSRSREGLSRGQLCWSALCAFAAILIVGSIVYPRYTNAQTGPLMSFPQRPKQPSSPNLLSRPGGTSGEQMLVRAAEINYDYTNDRVSAVGNVQIYYAGTIAGGRPRHL